MAKITVQDTDISIVRYEEEDCISLTDMARSQMQEHIIFRWLSLKSTLEYLGEWEMLYNPDFNCTEFGTIKNAAGSNNFVLSVKGNLFLDSCKIFSILNPKCQKIVVYLQTKDNERRNKYGTTNCTNTCAYR